MSATTLFGVDGSGGASYDGLSLKAYRKSFRKAATLQLTQRVLESSAAREHGQRTDRSRKGNERKVRSEEFVYLLLSKTDGAGGVGDAAAIGDAMWGAEPYGRVLGTPRKRTKHVLMDVLTAKGELRTFTITKRKATRSDYRYARKAREGNTVPMALFGTDD